MSQRSLDLYKSNLELLAKDIKKPLLKATEEDIIKSLNGISQATKNNRLVIYRDFYKYHKKFKIIERLKPTKNEVDDIKYRERVIT